MENKEGTKPFLVHKIISVLEKGKSIRFTKNLTYNNGINYINHNNTFIDVHLSLTYEVECRNITLHMPTLFKILFISPHINDIKENNVRIISKNGSIGYDQVHCRWWKKRMRCQLIAQGFIYPEIQIYFQICLLPSVPYCFSVQSNFHVGMINKAQVMKYVSNKDHIKTNFIDDC